MAINTTQKKNGRWVAWINPDFLYFGDTEKEALQRCTQAEFFGVRPHRLVCDNSRTIQS
jgi:hypothetical protein